MEETSLIELQAHELVDMIRRNCRGQVDLWHQVPSLALNADGRTGWSLQTAYVDGYWDIWGEHRSWRSMLVVELETGEIKFGAGPACDSDIIKLAFEPNRIDAVYIGVKLMRLAHEPITTGLTEVQLAARKREIVFAASPSFARAS